MRKSQLVYCRVPALNSRRGETARVQMQDMSQQTQVFGYNKKVMPVSGAAGIRYDHSSSDMEVQGKGEEHPNITQRPRRGLTEHSHSLTEDSQRTHRGLSEDSQRIRRELTEDPQRTHGGLTDSQRTHRGLTGLTEDTQRTHRGLTENSQRAHKDSPRFCRGLALRGCARHGF